MSIWGSLIGGMIGFSLGGPFGMLLGSLLGGKISRARSTGNFGAFAQPQQIFAEVERKHQNYWKILL